MTRPSVYSMPEGFIKDPSVPFRWKLYALVNGFWIGGKPVFASNEWLSLQLGCSERQVQRGIKELEDEGYLHRDGVSQNRQLLPVITRGTTPAVVGGRHQASQGDDASRPHTSDSISDNIHSEPTVRVEKVNENEGQPKTTKYPNKKAIFALWGKYPKNWESNKTQCIAAENLFEERGVDQIKSALKFYERHRDEEYCPDISSPYDLDSKWQRLLNHKNKRT